MVCLKYLTLPSKSKLNLSGKYQRCFAMVQALSLSPPYRIPITSPSLFLHHSAPPDQPLLCSRGQIMLIITLVARVALDVGLDIVVVKAQLGRLGGTFGANVEALGLLEIKVGTIAELLVQLELHACGGLRKFAVPRAARALDQQVNRVVLLRLAETLHQWVAQMRCEGRPRV